KVLHNLISLFSSEGSWGFLEVPYSAYLLKKLITYTCYIGLKLRAETGFRKRTGRVDL
ncbi:MAG: hypothetical protein IBX43_11045, partial [Campylobacterales bacterium]|nr:hypothetical protein [Campylobacterales bacterium]